MSKVSDTPSKVKSANNSPQSPTPGSVPDSEARTRISCASTVANCLDMLKINFWVEYEGQMFGADWGLRLWNNRCEATCEGRMCVSLIGTSVHTSIGV